MKARLLAMLHLDHTTTTTTALCRPDYKQGERKRERLTSQVTHAMHRPVDQYSPLLVEAGTSAGRFSGRELVRPLPKPPPHTRCLQTDARLWASGGRVARAHRPVTVLSEEGGR